MLSLALMATLVGFGLLVFALTTSNLILAIACVAVCVVGLVLLLIDTLRANRRGRDGEEQEPLFTIRGRESAAREEPLDDPADDEPHLDEQHGDDQVADPAPASAYGDQTASTWTLRDDQSSSGLGSLVAPTAEHVSGAEPVSDVAPVTDPGSGGFSPLSGGFAAVEDDGGDVNDYLRATGSFPAQAPATSEQQSLPESEHRPEPEPAPDVEPPSVPSESPAPYVGRRRLAGDPTDDIIVRSASPDLPAMQFVWEDPDEKRNGDSSN